MHAVTLTFSRHHLLEPGGGHTLGSPTGPGLILHQHSSNVDGVGVHLKKREREREREKMQARRDHLHSGIQKEE